MKHANSDNKSKAKARVAKTLDFVSSLLTIKEAASFLGISRQAIEQAIKEKRLEAIQLGRQRFLTGEAVRAYQPVYGRGKSSQATASRADKGQANSAAILTA